MRHPYQILLPLLSLFFCRVDLTDLFPLRYEVKLVEVLDGDTVIVQKDGYLWRIRLSKIDAPEKGQPFIKGGDAGEMSTKCLRHTLGKRKLTLEIEKFDIYRRILGDIGVNLDLVARGCAPLYPYAKFNSKGEKARYLRAQSRAKRLRLGLWAHGGFRQPKLWRKTSKRSAGRR
jgi:endonuclease YncB( thermonuclease family)